MPLKFTNSKTKGLTIAWTNEDKSRTATFTVPSEATDREQVEALVKALGFLVSQTGASVPDTSPTGTRGTAATLPTAPHSPAATHPSAPQVPMMPPVSLSDRPADGGMPGNAEFWQSMPTLSVPQELAGEGGGGWEMIPPGETWEA